MGNPEQGPKHPDRKPKPQPFEHPQYPTSQVVPIVPGTVTSVDELIDHIRDTGPNGDGQGEVGVGGEPLVPKTPPRPLVGKSIV
jgi:hypothetical protein